jgi:hypothetical protein
MGLKEALAECATSISGVARLAVRVADTGYQEECVQVVLF